MKIREIIRILDSVVINVPDDAIIVGVGYAGDFLSNVMVKAPKGCVWFTIMNNVNVAGVMAFAGVALTVLCEGVMPDSELSDAIKDRGLAVISTELSVFEAVSRMQNTSK